MQGRAVSRSALLELRVERRVVEDGHRFLDEKRALLAHELLARLARFGERLDGLRSTESQALEELRAAVAEEGLERLQSGPPLLTGLPSAVQATTGNRRSYLGVTVLDTGQRPDAPAARETPDDTVADPPLASSAHRCAAAVSGMLGEARAVAAELGNLLRLLREFQRTQRRVRALEKVVLPELRSEERSLEERLEEIDQEDAIHVRLAARSPGTEG